MNGSHPCAAVETAMELRGLQYSVVEWLPPMHAALQLAIFGARTVPGMKFDREKISGSRAIMRRLDELEPEPALYPVDPTKRSAVQEADRWGDQVLQPIARVLVWTAMRRRPAADLVDGLFADGTIGDPAAPTPSTSSSPRRSA